MRADKLTPGQGRFSRQTEPARRTWPGGGEEAQGIAADGSAAEAGLQAARARIDPHGRIGL